MVSVGRLGLDGEEKPKDRRGWGGGGDPARRRTQRARGPEKGKAVASLPLPPSAAARPGWPVPALAPAESSPARSPFPHSGGPEVRRPAAGATRRSPPPPRPRRALGAKLRPPAGPTAGRACQPSVSAPRLPPCPPPCPRPAHRGRFIPAGLRRCPLAALHPLPLGTGRGPAAVLPWDPAAPSRHRRCHLSWCLACVLHCGLERAPSRWGQGLGSCAAGGGERCWVFRGWGRSGLDIAASRQWGRNLTAEDWRGWGRVLPCAPPPDPAGSRLSEPPASGRSRTRPPSLGRCLQGCGPLLAYTLALLFPWPPLRPYPVLETFGLWKEPKMLLCSSFSLVQLMQWHRKDSRLPWGFKSRSDLSDQKAFGPPS